MTKAHIIDGVALASTITARLKEKILAESKGRPPGLATILVGNDKASTLYVANKRKTAEKIGIKSFHYELASNTTEKELLKLIYDLNNNQEIDGILVQLPLPKTINEKAIIEAVAPNKDVDGFHPLNLGYLFCGEPRVVACTPLGIMHILHSVNYSLVGKHAVVIGRSTIVGKPVAQLLLDEGATVTVCHSKTKDLASFTRQADVLVAAAGKAKLITKNHVKPGAFVIDVGINRDENNKLCGDVNFADVVDTASYITPVPGGVGPLTIAMLLKNTVDNYFRA